MQRSVVSVLALLAPVAALGQQTSGTIVDRVLGSGGQPVADVQVNVTSPSLLGW